MRWRELAPGSPGDLETIRKINVKILLEYDEVSGHITDKNGLSVCMFGMVGHEPEKPDEPDEPADKALPEILEMIRQGMTAEDLIKLKNSGVI